MKEVEAVLLEGDGIGPEITQAVLAIFEAAKVPIRWKPAIAGLKAIESDGDPLPTETLESIRSCGLALKAPLTTPIGKGTEQQPSFPSVNVQLRKELGLYANLRPVRLLPGVTSRYQDVDLLFVRENTEGLYSGLEHEIVPGVVTSLKVSSEQACTRIAEYCFATARSLGRKKVTGVHKANIMKLSDGLALECYRAVAARFPEIEYEERIIDATAMALVLDPSKFDVLLMENLYGDILSDLGAGLIGGLGLAPSANLGANCAVFEAVHGSAPDIAGQGIANPSALLLSAILMLEHLSLLEEANRIRQALEATLRDPKTRTKDLGGSLPTMDFATAIISRLQ